MQEPRESSFAGRIRGPLDSRFDGVNGSIGHGTHGARQPAQDQMLPTRQLAAGVLGLKILGPFFQGLVGGEVDGLI